MSTAATDDQVVGPMAPALVGLPKLHNAPIEHTVLTRVVFNESLVSISSSLSRLITALTFSAIVHLPELARIRDHLIHRLLVDLLIDR